MRHHDSTNFSKCFNDVSGTANQLTTMQRPNFFTDTAVLGIGFTQPHPHPQKQMKKDVKNPYTVLINVNT
jgi:hypothetical protein